MYETTGTGFEDIMEDVNNANRSLGEDTLGKQSLQRPRRSWKDGIKVDLR
jgi:hypothetical protein